MERKFIVTTTIQEPTEATLKFSCVNDWQLIVVGDIKTPHKSYENLDLIYLDVDYQKKNYPELSEAIGWNCIMRRNIGFIDAYRRGADIVASIDDDNIPYDDWGLKLFVNQNINAHVYTTNGYAFDPMSVTNNSHLWHRGFPINEIPTSRNPKFLGKENIRVEIQADLWDGDPDIDAICRRIYNPAGLKLECPEKFTSDKYIPFNSQNTFFARHVLPYYMVLPYVGRVDDIWGGYIAQHDLGIRPVFTRPTTYQDRNEQSIDKNLQDEVFGYITTERFLRDISCYRSFLPDATLKALDLYRKEYEK
jgi:hypothetical protein